MYPSNLEQIITTQLFLIRAKQTKQNKNLTEKRVHNDNFAACTMGVSEERWKSIYVILIIVTHIL